MRAKSAPHALKHSHVIVYPIYIDAEAKIFDGRKISKEDAIEKPNPKSMLAAVKALGFEAELQEDLRHPRDFWRFGRLSVKFFDGEGKDKKPINSEINSRRILYREIAKKMKEIGNSAPTGAGGSVKMTSQEKARMKREKRKGK